MEKVRLGKTKMMVSKLGFGGIPIQRVSEDAAVKIVRKCLELGITFIDTANAYSNSEERIGKAISDMRNGLVIATKTLARTNDEIEKHLKLSLKNLAIDYIDLYQLHSVNDQKTLENIIAPNGPISVIIRAKNQGLINHIGISCHSLDIAKQAVATELFETIMFPLNLITYEAAEELIPLARKYEVGFIAMKPLEGGILTNIPLALKYLLQFPDVVTIIGIQAVEEIIEVVNVADGPFTLTKSDQNEIERLRQELGNRFCRRCDYCQTCIQEIPISLALHYPSIAKRLPSTQILLGFVADAMEKAANCDKCGACEERCPYGLPIRDMLEDYVAQYQNYKTRYSG